MVVTQVVGVAWVVKVSVTAAEREVAVVAWVVLLEQV